MRWIKSAGGPLLIVERDLASLWGGISCSFSQQVAAQGQTDYDRACHISDYIGVIAIAGRHALVLGDMPLATSVWPCQKGSLVVRPFYMDSDESLPAVLNDCDISDLSTEIESLTFEFSSDDNIIFDSALTGSRIFSDFLEFPVIPGAYKIDTFDFKPDSRTSLLLHRFQRLGD